MNAAATALAATPTLERLKFLMRVTQLEQVHLQTTDTRLFGQQSLISLDLLKKLNEHIELAERIEAFASRYGRLQDTLGDKLLPTLLIAMGERSHTMVENLEQAQRLGWLPSVNDWLAARYLRNQMVHEYIEDPAIMQAALAAAHEFVPMLTHVRSQLAAVAAQRGWCPSV